MFKQQITRINFGFRAYLNYAILPPIVEIPPFYYTQPNKFTWFVSVRVC